jgi:hypothetical protein
MQSEKRKRRLCQIFCVCLSRACLGKSSCFVCHAETARKQRRFCLSYRQEKRGDQPVLIAALIRVGQEPPCLVVILDKVTQRAYVRKRSLRRERQVPVMKL